MLFGLTTFADGQFSWLQSLQTTAALVLSFIMSFIMFYPEMFVDYPLVNCDIAIEHGPVEIVDLPIKNGDFPSLFVCLPGAGISPETNLEMENPPSVVGRFPQQNRPNPRPCCWFFFA